MGKMVGRPSTRPSVLVNSRFVTGWGATALTGPASAAAAARIESPHEVVERDPTHVLPAAADDAAEAEAERREHFGQAAAFAG